MISLTWYGHSCFRIDTDAASIVIDPFFAPGSPFGWKDLGKVDLVLVTHDHGDHVGDTVQICQATGANLGAIVGTAGRLLTEGVPQAQILVGSGFNIGGTVQFKDVAITMTQAFHSSESGAPVGYILRLADKLTVYHAGDTGIFSSMATLGQIYGIDMALLPIGGVYTMDALQAANAAKLLGCPRVIPMHWGTFPVLAQSPDEFIRQLKMVCTGQPCECILPEPGVPLSLD